MALVDDVEAREVDDAVTELEGAGDDELVPDERRYRDIRLDPPQMSEANDKGVRRLIERIERRWK